nr:hypothetical protein [Nostoc sp. EkiNYC01]
MSRRDSEFTYLPLLTASPHPSFADAKPPLPACGEGIEGWGKAYVGQAFKLKLTPMHSGANLQAIVI